jgi:hypothetical protein
MMFRESCARLLAGLTNRLPDEDIEEARMYYAAGEWPFVAQGLAYSLVHQQIPVTPAEMNSLGEILRFFEAPAPRFGYLTNRDEVLAALNVVEHGAPSRSDRATSEQRRAAAPDLASPTMPTDPIGSPAADFVLRTGLHLRVEDSLSLGERVEGIGALAEAFDRSPLPTALRALAHQESVRVDPFRACEVSPPRTGLRWRLLPLTPGLSPLEAVAEVELSDGWEDIGSALLLTVDIVSRLNRRYSVPDLCSLLEGTLSVLVDRDVLGALADLSGVEPAGIPQPRVLHLVTGRDVPELLRPDGLTPVPGTYPNRTMRFVADPALDLRSPAQLRRQVDNYMRLIGLEGDVSGMSRLLDSYRRSDPEAVD